ncbi:MAG: amino acid adenylation domain-containing protein [Pyrinomonadaceae bacterium]|nr:amino acid adenylation domain-containing protein [Pyrinomonadaceae bacterium]
MLLQGIVDNPDQELLSLPLLGERGKANLLTAWNQTHSPYPLDRCFQELFEEQVANNPDAVAITFIDQRVSYQELNRRANRIARQLIARGVGPDSVVALYAERSINLLTAILAVFKAGGGYLPLDPAHPTVRLTQALGQSRTALVLAARELMADLTPAIESVPDAERPSVAVIEDLLSAAEPETNLPLRSAPGNLSYVIFTSGSTGTPKGAMLEHRGMLNHLYAKLKDLEIAASDVVAETASQCFDISVWQFLAALLVGGRTHIVTDEVTHDPAQLLEEIEKQEISIAETVPSMLRAMIEAINSGAVPAPEFKALRWMLVTGEALPPDLCRLWLALYPEIPLLNAYGPTECSDDVTHYIINEPPAADTVQMPIGRAISNTRIYVLDREMCPTPIGVPGELFVGGDGVGRGYLNETGRTADVFVPDPFSELGSRLYRTGDLARYLADGRIEYLGRIDHQVKVRGYRIELGEIEVTLRTQPSIHEAIVILREDSPGDQRLVAYLVASPPAPSLSELRNYVKERLPEYMVPGAFVMLDELPLTSNGKIDRSALPLPERSGSAGGADEDPEAEAAQALRTPVEELVASIWCQVLHRERVGAEEDFFELGGHSLLATQVISRVREAFAVEVALRRLFEAPTVRGLAASIEAAISGGRKAAGAIKPVKRDAAVPLSFAQQRLWFLDQLEPSKSSYNIPAAVRLKGQLDREAMARSLTEIVRRHEVLRTRFVAIDGQPSQIATPPEPVLLTFVDLSDLSAARRESEALHLAQSEAQRPFDLGQSPLLRVTLVRMSDDEHVLLLTRHHIITDAWSGAIFLREVATLYAAFSQNQPSPLAELPLQYADFAIWQRQWLQGELLERQLDYWRKQLQPAPALLELPTDYPRPPLQSFRGAVHSFNLSPNVARQLRALSRREGATLFMTLLAAFKLLLWRYTGQQQIVVGTPIANRNTVEVEGLIGFFANTLALRTEVNGELDFTELLRRVRETALGAYAHQDVPFEMLVEVLQPERNLSHNPIFQVLFSLQNNQGEPIKLEGLEMEPLAITGQTSKFDLSLMMSEIGEDLSASFEYNIDLFEPATIERLSSHFGALLESVVSGPEQQLSALQMLSNAELDQLLVEWNSTERPYPNTQCIHELFEVQVARTPDAVAIIFQDQSMTYRELSARANQLAHRLQAMGVGPDSLVGICLERSLEMVVGLLGILKAGGAYVPLDPRYPSERLSFMVEDAQAEVIVTHERLAETLPSLEARMIYLDRDRSLLEQESELSVASVVRPEHLAYVIYTSGSTGRPKGVQISHSAVINLLTSMSQQPGLNQDDTLLGVTTLSFDIAALEIYLPLISGARLVLASQEVAADGAQLTRQLAASGATVLQATPATWRMLIDAGWQPNKQLKALCGGEAIGPELATALVARTGEAWNVYGPTETTIWSTTTPIEQSDQRVTIGRPIANTEIYLLDELLAPVSIGIPSELYIGGAGLSRGYLKRPELTAEKFVPHPFSSTGGARLYRTGDLARYLSDGRIEYLGRIDHQVKLRGYRIELGEIEAALSTHTCVREAAVILREDIPGDKRLVAYLVTNDPVPSTAELRSHLKDRLPEYMVPSTFVLLDALPLTPNGKLDRRALPIPDGGSLDTGAAHLARTPIEEVVSGIWSQVLGREQVGVTENFFELGGHSLLATQVMSRVREAFGVEVALRRLFEEPTVRGLAASIEQGIGNGSKSAAAITATNRSERLPLSFAQQRLWERDRANPGSAADNTPLAFRQSGPLDLNTLEESFGEIVRRHEVLRTTFAEVDGQTVQVVHPAGSFNLSLIDLSHYPSSEREKEALRIANQEGWEAFDLSRGPLFKVKVIRLDADEHVILLLMHHLVIDPWSLGILLRELAVLYDAFSNRQQSPLPDLLIQYADYAAWQREWLQGDTLDQLLSYWNKKLQGPLPILELPTDRPRPAIPSHRGQTYTFKLSPELGRAIKVLSRREGVTPYMTLLTAFKAMLHYLTGQDDILVASPLANRQQLEIEGLIGFFASTVALRTDLSGDPTWRQLLARVRDTALGAYAHQGLPLEILLTSREAERASHASLETEPASDRSPLTPVSFTLMTAAVTDQQMVSLNPQPLDLEVSHAGSDLALRLWELADGFHGHVLYATDLFDEDTIAQIVRSYQQTLQALTADLDEPIKKRPAISPLETVASTFSTASPLECRF